MFIYVYINQVIEQDNDRRQAVIYRLLLALHRFTVTVDVDTFNSYVSCNVMKSLLKNVLKFLSRPEII